MLLLESLPPKLQEHYKNKMYQNEFRLKMNKKKIITHRSKIAIPYKYISLSGVLLFFIGMWMVLMKSKKGTGLVANYIDARDVMDRLDEVVGFNMWRRGHKEVNGTVGCGIGIYFESPGWVWKWDCGSESNMEKEKGEASDAFKRAGVKWGIGRFLYFLKIIQHCLRNGN